jgi:hypothetical protein
MRFGLTPEPDPTPDERWEKQHHDQPVASDDSRHTHRAFHLTPVGSRNKAGDGVEANNYNRDSEQRTENAHTPVDRDTVTADEPRLNENQPEPG